MGRRIIIDDDSDDDELLAVPCSSSLLSPAVPAVGNPPPANDAGNLSYHRVSPLRMSCCYLASACHVYCYYLRTHTMADPIIAGTADVIVIEDSCSSDVGSAVPDDTIIPSTSDVIVIVGSPCPPAAAATKPRCGTQLRGLLHAHVLFCPAAFCSPSVFDRSSSDSDSSDPDDPVSRAARRAAVRLATMTTAQRSSQHPSTIADFFRPISSAEYMSQVAAATQVDIMDLRSVVPAPAADIVSAADDVEHDLVSLPKRRRHGYDIDDFVVDTSESESDYSASSCS